jgi:hypothetical protein
MLKEYDVWTLNTTPISRQREVVNCREHGIQLTNQIKGNTFIEQLTPHHFVKLDSASKI